MIEGCLERDPAQRFPSVQAVIQELRGMLRELPDETRARSTPAASQTNADEESSAARSPRSASRPPIRAITPQVVAGRRVRGVGVGLQRRAQPRPRARPPDLPRDAARTTWSQSGQFPDANIFPKLVTVIDLTKIADPRAFVENWQRYFWPILKRVRQGLLTSLHKVIYDANSSSLLLFSEYVDEPRFGDRIAEARSPRRRRARARLPRDPPGRRAARARHGAQQHLAGRAAVQRHARRRAR